MLAKGTIVEVFEDPLTMRTKEGNAKIMGHVSNLDDGLDQYIVHFVGDAPNFHVVRTIAEVRCTGIDPIHCDDENCKVHGDAIRAHWVSESQDVRSTN